ncbi:hypothetical protein F503_05069 [Ophiostoma piceae UAMH 11346]|uniref:Uncharacterized protein n=1 Tax=Ophiostoma piceae (strain UAMH 11346) TaxID=1262450 RepID=S3C8Y5_OPHP1|nr:hypothetical protein F503_05069 [Ophiostoma piceae UAMH 11346]
MSFTEKNHNGVAVSSSEFDVHSEDLHLQSKVRSLRLLDAARAAATTLALLMGLVVLGISGNSIYVYNRSHSTDVAWLSAWPSSAAFDFKPTVALVAGSSLVIIANLIALTSHHTTIRSRMTDLRLHTPITFSAPFVGFISALVAIILFYVADSSATKDTLTSWSCRWRHLSTASPAPKFASLCSASHAAVDLAIILIPVEFIAFVLAGWELKVERYTAAYAHARKTPSPALS